MAAATQVGLHVLGPGSQIEHLPVVLPDAPSNSESVAKHCGTGCSLAARTERLKLEIQAIQAEHRMLAVLRLQRWIRQMCWRRKVLPTQFLRVRLLLDSCAVIQRAWRRAVFHRHCRSNSHVCVCVERPEVVKSSEHQMSTEVAERSSSTSSHNHLSGGPPTTLKLHTRSEARVVAWWRGCRVRRALGSRSIQAKLQLRHDLYLLISDVEARHAAVNDAQASCQRLAPWVDVLYTGLGRLQCEVLQEMADMLEGRAPLWGAPRCRLGWRGWPRDLHRVAVRCQQGLSRDQSLLPSETSLLAFTTMQNCSPPTSPNFQDTYGSIKSIEQSLLGDCQQHEGAATNGDLLQCGEKQLLELSTSTADNSDGAHEPASSKFRATAGAAASSSVSDPLRTEGLVSGAEPAQAAEGRTLQRQLRPPSPLQTQDWSHVRPRVRCWDTVQQSSRKHNGMHEQRPSSRDEAENGMQPPSPAGVAMTSPLGRSVGPRSVGGRSESTTPTGTPRPERPRQSHNSTTKSPAGHDAPRGHACHRLSQRQQTFTANGNRIHDATHPRLRRASSASEIALVVSPNVLSNPARAKPCEIWYAEAQRVLERANSVGRLPKPISGSEGSVQRGTAVRSGWHV